jgi:hypothetical protein
MNRYEVLKERSAEDVHGTDEHVKRDGAVLNLGGSCDTPRCGALLD